METVQMKFELLPIIILLVYLVGMLLIGFLSNKFLIKDSNDYLIGGRRMGLLFVAASLSANNVGGGSTTGVAAKAFNGWGLSAGWAEVQQELQQKLLMVGGYPQDGMC